MVNKERLVQKFMEMVQIDSVSLNERKMVDYLVKHFKGKGYEVVEDMTPMGKVEGATAGNIVVKIPGNPAKETLVVCSHTDTVEPGNGVKPQMSEDGQYITSDGTTILGADDKAGLAQILEMVELLEENDIDHPPLEIFMPICEEVGLLGAQHFDSRLLDGKKIVVLDGGAVPGDVIVGAPSYYKVFGKVVGKASHAGGRPEAGISSIQVVAKAIAKMNMLRVDEETTTNVGKVICDYPLNVVPEVTTFALEVRSLNDEKAQKQVEHVLECFQSEADSHGATFTYTVEQMLMAYEMEDDHPMLQKYQAVCEKMGVAYHPFKSGGGSDLNALQRYHGMEGIVIATAGENAHTLQERVHVDNFVACTEQLMAIVEMF